MAFLEKISHGILWFYSEHRYFPWEDPRPTSNQFNHSWRVVLLPALEKEDPAFFAGATELFRNYKFSEAWDSPHNNRLAQEAGNFCSRDRSDASTSMLAIDTQSGESDPLQSHEFRDSDISLIQFERWATHWMDPYNPSLDQVETLMDQYDKQSDVNAQNRLLVASSSYSIYRYGDWVEHKKSEARRQAWREYDQRKAKQESKVMGE